MNKLPSVLTIAGSDSGGGAGIQADIKTGTLLGCHVSTAITALTAQNTCGVTGIDEVAPAFLRQQLDAVFADLPPQAVKSGMLASADLVSETADFLERYADLPYVCDPVMIATSGDRLLDAAAIGLYQSRLIPRATLLTPNIPEAEALTGHTIKTRDDMEYAAGELRRQGAKQVYLKGGHLPQEDGIYDLFLARDKKFWLRTPVRHGSFHGTGCTFAAAAAAGLAQGLPLAESVIQAQSFVANALAHAATQGRGSLLLGLSAWPSPRENIFPELCDNNDQSPNESFAALTDGPIGFYPIVPSAAWVERLVPLGVRTIQLRIKEASREQLDTEICAAQKCAKLYGCRLFVNDHWDLALKHHVYGVHLGQEDLHTADLAALRAAGIRLGLSSHSYEEAARAHALRPSYIALGPIFATTTKRMPWQPQGFDRIRTWQLLLERPIVAIGGLKLEHVKPAVHCGADGVAVITDLLQADNVEKRLAGYLAEFHSLMP